MRHRIQRMNILNAELEIRGKKAQSQKQGPNSSGLDAMYEMQRARYGNAFEAEYD
jgi:hypothetical protein